MCLCAVGFQVMQPRGILPLLSCSKHSSFVCTSLLMDIYFVESTTLDFYIIGNECGEYSRLSGSVNLGCACLCRF